MNFSFEINANLNFTLHVPFENVLHCFHVGTPTLPIFHPPKSKYTRHEIEEDENDIDMSAINNPKLSSTRIERPRRAVPAPKNVPKPVATAEPSKAERPHSDIIEKVLAGIPLTDNEIRRVIHRKK